MMTPCVVAYVPLAFSNCLGWRSSGAGEPEERASGTVSFSSTGGDVGLMDGVCAGVDWTEGAGTRLLCALVC